MRSVIPGVVLPAARRFTGVTDTLRGEDTIYKKERNI